MSIGGDNGIWKKGHTELISATQKRAYVGRMCARYSTSM